MGHSMNLKKITTRIEEALKQSSESDEIEFKDARGGLSTDIWKSISAFSNSSGGGLIIFGIREDRQKHSIDVVGGLEIATLQEKIVSLFQEKMKNAGSYRIKPINYKGSDLLVLEIEETSKEHKPCYNNDLGLPNGAYIRVGNVNKKITEEEMRAFLRFSPQYKYDKITTEFGKEVLSEAKLESFLKKSANRTKRKNTGVNTKLLRNLGILVKSNMGKDFVSLAGFLIFCQDVPQKIDPYNRYKIRCVRYAGKNVATEIIDKQDIIGTLDVLIEDTLKFVLRNISLKAQIVGAKRKETYQFPEKAIREVVANAIIHRDYQITGTYVQINIFSDRIEISNPGTLPPGLTVENLKDSQFSRNEVIARIMNDLDYMEEFGRGIDLVYSFMKEWGLVEPLFKNKSNTFKVTLLGDEYSELNKRQVKMWYQMQDEGSITARTAHLMFEGVSRATINNDLQVMVKLGLIESRGASINTFYVPTY